LCLVGFLCSVLGFSFCGKLLFRAIICINIHSFCFLFGVNRRECIQVMWYMKAAILCTMGWFEKKFMFVSVVVGLRNMYISRLDGFWIMYRSAKLIHPLFSYV